MICPLSFVLLVISTVITRSGWVHASLMPIMCLLLFLPLLLAVLNWSMGLLIGLVGICILFQRMYHFYVMRVFRVVNIGRYDHASLGVSLNLSLSVVGFDVACSPPTLKPLIFHGYPIVIFYRKTIRNLKTSFPIQTTKKRFQILKLHPKKTIIKKYIFWGYH